MPYSNNTFSNSDQSDIKFKINLHKVDDDSNFNNSPDLESLFGHNRSKAMSMYSNLQKPMKPVRPRFNSGLTNVSEKTSQSNFKFLKY